MKYILITIVASAMLCFAACKKERSPYQSEYDKSLQAWLAFKTSANNSYQYTTYRYDPRGFVAHYYQTTITVSNGQITARSYEDRNLSNTGTLFDSYTETQATLGTHQSGDPLLTLDQVYERTKKEWLSVDQKKNIISFEVAGNGLLASAGYAPNDCSVECFKGVYIKEIVRL